MKRTMKTSDDLKSFCCWNAFDSTSMGQLEGGCGMTQEKDIWLSTILQMQSFFF